MSCPSSYDTRKRAKERGSQAALPKKETRKHAKVKRIRVYSRLTNGVDSSDLEKTRIEIRFPRNVIGATVIRREEQQMSGSTSRPACITHTAGGKRDGARGVSHVIARVCETFRVDRRDVHKAVRRNVNHSIRGYAKTP